MEFPILQFEHIASSFTGQHWEESDAIFFTALYLAALRWSTSFFLWPWCSFCFSLFFPAAAICFLPLDVFSQRVHYLWRWANKLWLALGLLQGRLDRLWLAHGSPLPSPTEATSAALPPSPTLACMFSRPIFSSLLKSLWMPAQPSSLSTSPPHSESSVELPRVCSVPSAGSLMKSTTGTSIDPWVLH